MSRIRTLEDLAACDSERHLNVSSWVARIPGGSLVGKARRGYGEGEQMQQESMKGIDGWKIGEMVKLTDAATPGERSCVSAPWLDRTALGKEAASVRGALAALAGPKLNTRTRCIRDSALRSPGAAFKEEGAAPCTGDLFPLGAAKQGPPRPRRKELSLGPVHSSPLASPVLGRVRGTPIRRGHASHGLLYRSCFPGSYTNN
ncbi:hypothetical protein NDU88_011412 [Pleurodeles waltl]|uniref:Uncharacterized protein n=1 Tax=Pleurodeles waltl TaxID=8319 RepID=A0AAV7R0X6_PLEWA|nr:hypothetical protein NDU88_011412 [Pleurodeles waltl]